MSRAIKLLGALITLSALGLAAGSAFAQGWPTKPVRVIVALPPGSGTDITGRAVAASLSAAALAIALCTGQKQSGVEGAGSRLRTAEAGAGQGVRALWCARLGA